MLTSTPTKVEMLAMTPVLFTDETALPGQAFADAAAKEQEVLDRCALVGCDPRTVFSGAKFLDGLTDIIDASTNVASTARTDLLTKYYRGSVDTSDSTAASSVSSRLYNIGPSADSRDEPFVMLKPLVAHLWRAELEQYFANMNGKRAFEYEDLSGLLLRGGSIGGRHAAAALAGADDEPGSHQ